MSKNTISPNMMPEKSMLVHFALVKLDGAPCHVIAAASPVDLHRSMKDLLRVHAGFDVMRDIVTSGSYCIKTGKIDRTHPDKPSLDSYIGTYLGINAARAYLSSNRAAVR